MMYIPSFRDLPLGCQARGTINKEKVYRVRTGNGYYGTTLGRKYQDTMNYYTPFNPRTGLQEANRTKFANAMASALALNEAERIPYKVRAKAEGRITWFNVYIRDAMVE